MAAEVQCPDPQPPKTKTQSSIPFHKLMPQSAVVTKTAISVQLQMVHGFNSGQTFSLARLHLRRLQGAPFLSRLKGLCA